MPRVNLKASTIRKIHAWQADNSNMTFDGPGISALYRLIQMKGEAIVTGDDDKFKGMKVITLDDDHWFGMKHFPAVKGSFFPCAIKSYLLTPTS